MREIRVNEELRDVLLHELDRLERPIPDSVVSDLRAALRQGVVRRELLEALGTLIEVGYRTGRVRAIHGPHAEMALLRLYRHTPQGQAVLESLNPLNKGLEGLVGQTIEGVSVTLAGPGAYDITIETDRCQMRIEVSPRGARVKSVELGF